MIPTNLPARPTGFVGRERELAEVGQLLTGTRLLTLTGAGGVGKTRLALQVAAGPGRRDEIEPCPYPDGIWLVELAAFTDPALVPSAVAAALGLREKPGRPLLATLTDHLHARSLLLLLDNCEHLLPACATLAEALLRACPQLQILTTSRQALGLTGETLWPVPPMAVPDSKFQVPSGGARSMEPGTWNLELEQADSVRLFIARATAVNPHFSLTERNAEAVVEICRRLDGIPLALELAAARVKVLAVEQIAERLSDRFRLLTRGSRTALPRQQTLRGTLDWSYALLTEPERVLLRRLAVFAGGWTLEAAEQVCTFDAGDSTYYVPGVDEGSADTPPSEDSSVSPPDILDMLTELIDKSLVVAEEQEGATRYELLETIRQYGLERLEASEEVELLRRRHAEHYLALAEEAEPHLPAPGQGQWLERIHLEHDNLRAALNWLTEHDADLGLRLGVALLRFWDVHGYLTEGRERLSTLLVRAERRGQTAAQVLRGLGTFARKQGDFDTACRLLEEGLAICRELDDSAGEAYHLNSLALVRQDLGELDTARVLASEALTILRRLGDDWGAANALMNLASIVKNIGDVAAAVPLEDESLALKRRTGDLLGLGLVLNNIGVTAERLGDLETARTRYEESLAIKRQIGDRWGSSYSLLNLGTVTLAHGDHDTAAAWYDEALRLASQLGDRFIVAECLHGLGAVAGTRSAIDGAVRLFAAAEALRDSIGARLSGHRRAEDDRRIGEVRASLSEEAFAALWAEGQSMPLDEAIACALSVAEPSATSEEPAPSADNDPLSAREREVATLLAQGLTNRRIAEELVVATSTVDRHVVNILRKLDLTSRAQVAAWAVAQGLTATTH
jgi:predicted ATPase/DNA-binding CsgD family transcriptional regulator